MKMKNGDLSSEQLKEYKKVFVRHLKDDGIYSAVRSTFIQKNITFNDYIKKQKKNNDVIGDMVDTIWSIVNSSTSSINGPSQVMSSIFMLNFIVDDNFKKIFHACNGSTDRLINTAVRNEINYLFNSSIEDEWRNKRISNDIAERLNEFLVSNHYDTIITPKEQSLINLCRLNNND